VVVRTVQKISEGVEFKSRARILRQSRKPARKLEEKRRIG
jgi:preprotein translocase subunit Sss1